MIMTLIIKDKFPSQNSPSIFCDCLRKVVCGRTTAEKDYKIHINIYQYMNMNYIMLLKRRSKDINCK